ncbi:hypothetical protein Tco_1255559 [Tanacetum coccineum]
MQEIKRLADLKAEKEKSEKKLKKLELHALASKVQSKSNDQILKNLKAKFQWVETQAGKLSIPSPPELIAFELLSTDKKRKKKAEVIQEVFVKDNSMVDGMHRNLVPPAGVVGLHGLVINEHESGIFV